VTKLSLEEFNRRFDELETEGFRCELLPEYDYPGEQEELERWRRGEEVSEKETNSRWQQRLRVITGRGTTFRRVRVVDGEPNEYQRHGIEWWFPYNDAAGEKTFICDVARTPIDLPDHDFWILDGVVIRMNYDDGNRFIGPEIVPEQEWPKYEQHKEALLRNAVPLREFSSEASAHE
jgi:hypothetical protein